MPLSIGKHLGPYEILAPLGAGGMGEVYRARDTRLGRNVALKVLPELFSSDAERMARFEREAQLLASLNHPNIASLYGLEESGGVRALVMELVEGPTLAERIHAAPLALDEALPIARQIADALEAAHEKGIIHRDLKPANVKVTRDGTVKVLDFGLAKALEDAPASGDLRNSPTMSMAATRAGVILGTAAYMPPEQAKGKVVDRRADIWAFGVVLMEMLTGRQVYSGETAPETLAAVMKDEPRWESLPAGTPAAIRKLLRRCLDKDPKRRLRDIGEARITIDEVSSGAPAEEPVPASTRPPVSASRRLLPWGAAALAAIAGAVAGWMLQPSPPEPPLRKFELPVEKLSLSIDHIPRLSPDGRKIVYAAGQKLWIRDLGQLDSRELVPAGDPAHFFWSPDSAFVAYLADGKLWKVAAAGGQPTVITVLRQNLGRGVGGAWGPDGKIIFTTANPGTGLLEVSAQGGDFTTTLAPKSGAEQDFHDVSLLPDGQGVLYVIDRGQGIFDTIAFFSRKSRKEIVQWKGEGLRSPLYSPTGHILYHRETNNPGIWALPFSLAKLEVTGEPFLVAPQGTLPSISREGTLSFVRQAGTDLRQLVWVDRSGKVEAPIGEPQRGLGNPALSPDGRRVSVAAGESQKHDLWVYDVARGTRTRLTFTEVDEQRSAWSPSGDRIFFDTGGPAAANWSIAAKRADGAGPTETLVKGLFPSVSRDGKFLAYSAFGEKTALDLWYVALDGERKPAPFLETPANDADPQFPPSREGPPRYLAYTSSESGHLEVYIKPFPSGEGKWQVSSNSGFSLRWGRSGDKLYYIEQPNKLMEVEVATRPSLTLGTPHLLFSGDSANAVLLMGYDVAPDGKRFVVVQEALARDSKPPAITVIQNWFAEFKSKEKK